MSSSEVVDHQGDLLADADAELEKLRAFATKMLAVEPGEDVPPEVVQEGLTALVRLYTARHQAGERWPPFSAEREIPDVSAMIMSTAVLRSVNVELFELGMWQAWSSE